MFETQQTNNQLSNQPQTPSGSRKGLYGVIAVLIVVALVAWAVYAYKVKQAGNNQKGAANQTTQHVASSRISVDDLKKLQDILVNQHNYALAETQAAGLEQQYPQDANIKLIKGEAQFQEQKWDAAKTTFDAVLALDPKNTAAQSYQKLLSDKNVQFMSASGTEVSQSDFETKLGLQLDSSAVSFVRAFHMPLTSPFTESISASYLSKKTYAQTVKYIKDLVAQDVTPVAASPNQTNFENDNAGNGVSYMISVFNNASNHAVSVVINYAKK